LREQASAPRWAGDELAATHQAAARAHNDALVWRPAPALEQLDARAAQLQAADDARAARGDGPVADISSRSSCSRPGGRLPMDALATPATVIAT
jgi:hypothetical protein